jgi:hypothetical protein
VFVHNKNNKTILNIFVSFYLSVFGPIDIGFPCLKVRMVFVLIKSRIWKVMYKHFIKVKLPQQRIVNTKNLRVVFSGTRQTLQKNSVGFSPWENTEIPWDVSVLFFSTPPLINNGIFLPILFREKTMFYGMFYG